MSNEFYNLNAQEVSAQYLSKSFEQVHQNWIHLLPATLNKPNARILDVGGGSGRDAKYFAKQLQTIHDSKNISDSSESKGQVFAIEPAKELAKWGEQTTKGLGVKWLQDTLPALENTTKLEISFDLILLSAVWMHIPPSDRARAFRKLTNLLKPGGQLVISLRHGHSDEERKNRNMFDVSAGELKKLASEHGLFVKLETELDKDQLGRGHVSWQTVVLGMPDDGTGAFPFIRHVAINDGKSATHKLALMRVLLRIADGHSGAVLRRESSPDGDRVILPAGLVALYWCHQYKDLIDLHGLFQTPAKSPNMGFMKADGWHKLTHRLASDYRIGNLFTGEDAKALFKTLSATLQNIKNMPCKYITFPNTSTPVFEVESKAVKAKDSLFLDLPSLEQWGEFSMPESTWLAFNRYACWIEPVLVSEWVKTMASYKGNKEYSQPAAQYQLFKALEWLEPKRTTIEVRQRVDVLKRENKVECVWSAKEIRQKFDIDHSMPFSRWPNNDLWNLVPSDSKVNSEKRDRLPTEQKLKASRDRIQSWWKNAWLDDNKTEEQRFFAEANIALPGLDSDNTSIDDLFEALVMQRSRLKEMQQLREW